MGILRIYKVGSPFNASELSEVDWVQSFDVMYLAHLDHVPSKLTRASHTSWAFSDITFGPTVVAPSGVTATATTPNTDAANSGDAYFPQPATYVVTTIDGDTAQESRGSTPSTCTNDLTLKRNFNTIGWSAVTGAVRYRIYKAENTGSLGYAGQTESLSFVDDFIEADLTVGPPTGNNPFTGTGNYPSTVAFFEGRLWWARTRNNPNALFSSRSADFENQDISEPLRADDAITIRLVSQGVNHINQLASLQSLLGFTSDGIYKIEGSNEDYLSASPPPRVRRQSGTPCSRLSPLVVDSVAFYKSDNSAEIFASGYDFQIDGIKSSNVTIYSPDFFEGFDIVSWCYSQQPYSVIWAARSDGALLCFTWEKEQQVWGWTICPLANEGKVKSLCSIPEIGSDGMVENRVYAIIEFTIAGVAREVRCRMASGRWFGLNYACHMDCSTTVTFTTPSSVVTGLWYLEGETVAALVDGLAVEGLVVANGQITLPEGYQGSVITVGLPFDVHVETLPLFVPTGQTNAGRVNQTGDVNVALLRSRPPTIGVRRQFDDDVDDNKMYTLKTPYAAPGTSEDSLLNGVYEISTEPVTNGEASIVIKHRITPLSVTAVYIDLGVTG